jgi:MYXO-CTERM domain-containing protein
MESQVKSKSIVAIAMAFSCAGIASASVINSAVSTSVTGFNGTGSTTLGSGSISLQSGIGDEGAILGTIGTNAAIRGKYTTQAMAGVGSHGGALYLVNVVVGSIKKTGPFAASFNQVVVNSGYTFGGSAMSSATIGFGVGGNGLRFNDFGGANQLYIETGIPEDGLTAYSMKLGPNGEVRNTQTPSNELVYASIAADGSAGFSVNFSTASLWLQGSDVGSLFGGNLAAFDIYGWSSNFVVEVAAVPAPGAIALLGLAGLAGRRRRN